MKVEYWTCDECGKQLNGSSGEFDEIWQVLEYHICRACQKSRLENCFRLAKPIGFKTQNCERCKGKGTLKEFYGYNNDYEIVKCDCTIN